MTRITPSQRKAMFARLRQQGFSVISAKYATKKCLGQGRPMRVSTTPEDGKYYILKEPSISKKGIRRLK